MRNAALTIGIIGGIIGMIVGFFSYGYTEFIDWFGEVPDVAEQVDNVQFIRVMALIAPLLAIAGGGLPFAPAKKVFREWVQVPGRDEALWSTLIDEGLAFVS